MNVSCCKHALSFFLSFSIFLSLFSHCFHQTAVMMVAASVFCLALLTLCCQPAKWLSAFSRSCYSCVRAGVHRVHSRHKKQHWKTKPSRFTHLKRHVRTTKDQDSRCKPAHLQSGSARHLCEYLSRPPQDKHADAYTRESTRLSSQTAVKETVCDVRLCVIRSKNELVFKIID